MAETIGRHLERMADAARPTGATAFEQPGERVSDTDGVRDPHAPAEHLRDDLSADA